MSWFGELKKGWYWGLFFSINGWKIEFYLYDLINDKRERSSYKCFYIDMYYLYYVCVSCYEECEELYVFFFSMDDCLKCIFIRCIEYLLKVCFIIFVYNINFLRF